MLKGKEIINIYNFNINIIVLNIKIIVFKIKMKYLLF